MSIFNVRSFIARSSFLPAFLTSLALSSLSAQEIPFSEEPENFISERRLNFWKHQSANRALEIGLYDLAYALAEEIIEDPATLTQNQIGDLRLVAIDSLLALENVDEAEQLIAESEGFVDSNRLILRRLMVAFARDEVSAASSLLATLNVDSLNPGDDAWHWLIRGWLDFQNRDDLESEAAFAKAVEIASELDPGLQAHFSYLIFRFKLETQVPDSPSSLEELRRLSFQNQGTEIGYRYSQLLALMLSEQDLRAEAISLVAAELETLPAEFIELRDEFLLLQMLLSGVDLPEGRQAALELAVRGQQIGLARFGLQYVVYNCLERSDDKQLYLDEVLNLIVLSTQPHPLRDEALYYRAVSKFLNRDYRGAEADAELLENTYHVSTYRKGVLAIRASSAWQQARFRTAARHLSQLRSEYADSSDSNDLTVLIADSLFRAGRQAGSSDDYLLAATEYTTALDEVENAKEMDDILFQLVLSYLNYGDIAKAQAAIENPDYLARSRSPMIWRAEWMLLKEMRKTGARGEAYERVYDMLNASETSGVLDADLKLRFLWLATKLSLESGQPDEAETWVNRLNAYIAGLNPDDLDQELIDKVKASALLTLADSFFGIGEEQEALTVLEALRRDYDGEKHEPALFSYILEARYLSAKNRIVEAQQLLGNLADNYPQSRLAPIALYEAALNAEKRGQEANIEQANQLLERIATNHPDSEMVYYARLKQADLLRKRNEFGAAQQIYSLLENEYSDREDYFLAQISMADTLRAKAGDDPSKYDLAISRLERLMDLPDVHPDLRTEAGCKLGLVWRDRNDLKNAKEAFWTLQDLFISEENRIRFLTGKGRYWLSKAFFGLAEIYQEERDLDKAVELYETIIMKRLPGTEIARSRVDRILKPSVN